MHAVTLTWHASPQPPTVRAYRIYRSTVGPNGPFSGLATGVKVTKYVDSLVTPRVSYWYRVRAVGLDGELSNPSNTIKVTIP